MGSNGLNVINDKFNIPAVNSSRISLLIYLVNNENDNSSVELFDYITVKITYNDNVNASKIDVNTDNFSFNSSKIKDNENNISSNLINIRISEDNIAYNLGEINYIKNNISKSYQKNFYNIQFYDNKTQIDFRNLFYEKVFDVNAGINYFIEMNFKISL